MARDAFQEIHSAIRSAPSQVRTSPTPGREAQSAGGTARTLFQKALFPVRTVRGAFRVRQRHRRAGSQVLVQGEPYFGVSRGRRLHVSLRVISNPSPGCFCGLLPPRKHLPLPGNGGFSGTQEVAKPSYPRQPYASRSIALTFISERCNLDAKPREAGRCAHRRASTA